MQIWNGCNTLNIVGNPVKDISVNLSFLSSGSKVVEWPPKDLTSGGNFFEILILHVLSNDACTFAINLFAISWRPFQNVNLLFFLLKMQIWNGCNVCNTAENLIKHISVNLSFGGHVFRGQRKFGDKRPFTCKGNYLVCFIIWSPKDFGICYCYWKIWVQERTLWSSTSSFPFSTVNKWNA